MFNENNDNDTIAAISTPPGEGGIGIVRISGPESKNIALKIFVGAGEKCGSEKNKEFNPLSKRLYYGYIVDENGKEIDEVLLSFMKAPYTYTREDIVEINAHGGLVPLGKILKLVMEKGARLAEPGEFTRRAYLNGRIDLLQAESILSIVRAKTEKALSAAIQGLKGIISGEIIKIRNEIIDILTEIEADIEFSHEDPDIVESEQYGDIAGKVKGLEGRLELLLKKRKQGKILQEGLKTVIIGKPNVGKSSLYNYLVREERAIVTEVPGTTRDLLIEYINIKGVPLKLIDTAGLHKSGDLVEKIGMEISKKAIKEADLLLFILDAYSGITDEDKWIYEQIPLDSRKNLLVIFNKIDLNEAPGKELFRGQWEYKLFLETSMLRGKGHQ